MHPEPVKRVRGPSAVQTCSGNQSQPHRLLSSRSSAEADVDPGHEIHWEPLARQTRDPALHQLLSPAAKENRPRRRAVFQRTEQRPGMLAEDAILGSALSQADVLNVWRVLRVQAMSIYRSLLIRGERSCLG